MDFIKIKNVCFVKDPAKREKRKATDGEKIFANHISTRGLLTRYTKNFQVSTTTKKFGPVTREQSPRCRR